MKYFFHIATYCYFDYFTDCIKTELKKVLDGEKLFSTCSVSWLVNITGELYNPLLPPCNISEATNQSLFLGDFFTKARLYGFPQCPGTNYLK